MGYPLELCTFLSEHEIDIACITITSLTPTKKNFVRSFSAYHYERVDDRSGGVLILINSTIKHIHSLICITGANDVGVNLKDNRVSLQVVACYNNPQPVRCKDKIESDFQPGSTIHTIMTGDLNVKHDNWKCRQTNPNGQRLARVAILMGLSVEAPHDHI